MIISSPITTNILGTQKFNYWDIKDDSVILMKKVTTGSWAYIGDAFKTF